MGVFFSYRAAAVLPPSFVFSQLDTFCFFAESGYYAGSNPPTMLPKQPCNILIVFCKQPPPSRMERSAHRHHYRLRFAGAHKWLTSLLLAHPEQAAVGGGSLRLSG